MKPTTKHLPPALGAYPQQASWHFPHYTPDHVFDFVTDIESLPRWNDLIAAVVERPASFERGSTWRVRMQHGPMSWTSRSVVVDYDRAQRRFVHRSGTDDGNPSYTEWCWQVSPAGDGALLTVGWRLAPLTRFRQLALAPYRARRLRREVPNSLRRIAKTMAEASPSRPLDLTAPLTLLGIWAHPDDEAYLSAALMARVVRSGGRVVVVTATAGEAGLPAVAPPQATAIREAELRRALAAVGVDDVRLLGLPDGGCAAADSADAVAKIEGLLTEVEPDLVVTFGPDGITGHDDHVAISRWTLQAWQRTRRGRLLLAAMSDDFRTTKESFHREIGMAMGPPLHSVPAADLALVVSPTFDERNAKRAALEAHRSQTAALAERVGVERFHDWWVDEMFRAPTGDDFVWAGEAREVSP